MTLTTFQARHLALAINQISHNVSSDLFVGSQGEVSIEALLKDANERLKPFNLVLDTIENKLG